jgi:hypothetical protein
MIWLYLALGIALLLIFLAVMWRIGAAAGSPALALEKFAKQRAELQSAFFRAAESSGKPRGLRWKSIDWQDGVELVREKDARRLAALVGVTIAFEAIPGSDMEGLPAVGNLRHGSAVFFYHRGTWHTTGKAIFNLMPEEVIERFAAQYERVAPSPPQPPSPTKGRGGSQDSG